jgi:hypothetical protein
MLHKVICIKWYDTVCYDICLHQYVLHYMACFSKQGNILGYVSANLSDIT